MNWCIFYFHFLVFLIIYLLLSSNSDFIHKNNIYKNKHNTQFFFLDACVQACPAGLSTCSAIEYSLYVTNTTNVLASETAATSILSNIIL